MMTTMAVITPDVYDTCLSVDGAEGQDELLSCMSGRIQNTQVELLSATSVFFIIYAASLVFFMQAGFAMLCSGSVRRKNVQNTMLKNLLDACGAAMGFFSVGYAFAFGGNETGKTFIGNGNFFLIGLLDDHGSQYSFWLFQYAFAATSATIVAGTMAERCQMNAYLIYSMTLTGFVYPVVVHNIWSSNGFLSRSAEDPLWGIGMIDYAGSGVVHTTGGLTALIASVLLGPRKGRFHDERGEKLEIPTQFPGHSKSLQMLGTFILWFGWYGFNAGSALDVASDLKPLIVATAVVNTTLSAASAGITALFLNLFIVERQTGEAQYNLLYAMNGCLSGLVAVTGSCAFIEPWAAVVVGFVAGLIYLGTSNLLIRYCIDDAVDAIPVHFANGVWGVISVGLFASHRGLSNYLGVDVEHVGWFYSWGRSSGDATLLACQVVGLLFITGWVSVIMTPFFFALNYLGMLRADSLEEIVGLDVSYHGFQTTNVEDVNPEWLQLYQKRQREKGKRIRVSSREEGDDDDESNIDKFG